MMNEQTFTNQEVESAVEENQSNYYEQSFSEEALRTTSETEENNLTEVGHTSNGLENFGVEGESAPDLFSSDNETTETESLLPIETSENVSEEDDLEIPAFLRRQKN
jgi:cell division protein FtsZ